VGEIETVKMMIAEMTGEETEEEEGPFLVMIKKKMMLIFGNGIKRRK